MEQPSDPRARRLKIDEDGAQRNFLNNVRDRCRSGMSFRELTHNALQAYVDHGLTGEVVWHHEVDPADPTRGRWALRDTACGMSYAEMDRFLGAIHATSGTLGTQAGANYGIGAKLACLKDHQRTRWVSLKDGKVSWCELWIENELAWWSGGKGGPAELAELDAEIRSAGRGTQVRFPEDLFEERSKLGAQKLSKDLSQRYHRLPDGIVMRVENWTPQAGKGLYTVDPQSTALKGLSSISQSFTLFGGEVVVEVWVLMESDAAAPRKYYLAGLFRDGKPLPRSAVVLLDEQRGLEEAYGSTQGAHNRVRRCGFRAGWKRVHLIWKPDPHRYITHEDRSGIRPRSDAAGDLGSEIDWDRWVAALAEQVQQCEELQAYIRSQEKTPPHQLDQLRLDFARFIGILSGAADAGGRGTGRGTGGGGGSAGSGGGGGSGRPSGSGGRRHGVRIPNIKWVGAEDEDYELVQNAPAALVPEADGSYTLELNREWSRYRDLRGRLENEASPFGGGQRGPVTAQETAEAALEMLGLDLVFRHDREGRDQPEPADFTFGMDSPLGLRSVATEWERFRASRGAGEPSPASEE